MKRILFLLPLLALVGCRQGAPLSEDVTIAAAASLSSAFRTLGDRFTAQTGVPVTFSFAATGTLSEQIRNGAPFDVFAAADTAHVDQLIQKGFVLADSRTVFAYGELVLAFAPGVKGTSLDDLRDPRFEHIALANPEIAPFGLAAQQALTASGLWEALAPRLVFGENVRQTFQFVASGDAQAGFVPRGFAESGHLAFVTVPPEWYAPIAMGTGLVATSPHAVAAQQFLDFLLSPQAQAILEAHGFRKVR